MRMEIKYSTGERYEANIPDEAIKDSIPCMFDSLHTSCGKMAETHLNQAEQMINKRKQ